MKNAPRWLIGLALLFWGWQTGLFPWAFAMAATLEASHFTKARWEFGDADLNRICDLCVVLFVAAGTLLFSTEDRLMFVFKFAQWLPFCFFPVALVQSYGGRNNLALSAFNWLLRRIPQSPLAHASLNISYAYFAICLLAASATTRPDPYFYTGVSFLILLALAGVRPKRVSWLVWTVLALAVLLGGRMSQQGLRQLQSGMEAALGRLMAGFSRSAPDPREVRTHIGRSGDITLSGKIVLRLRVPPDDLPPALLREGAYDSYKQGIWMSGSRDFYDFYVNSNGTAELLPPRAIFSRVEIAGYFPNGEGTLPLPHGAFEIEDFDGDLLTNRLGAAIIQAGPGLLNYRVKYWTAPSLDGRPGPADLGIPEDERPALRTVAASLGLDQMTNERQKIRAVGRFFHDNFRYTLQSQARPMRNREKTALGRFLTETRAGHCEYFATATVLLLRQAGVKARYITGFAVPETARRGETFLVREWHRHAWAVVYHSDTGTWEQVDNTPSSWIDAANASMRWWEPASDFLSGLYYDFSKWRWGKTSVSHYAQWALGPLILYLVWRILWTRRRLQTDAAALTGPSEPVWPGQDSELYLIDRRLAEIHLSRQPNEPLSRWQQRLEEAFPDSAALGVIFEMHRRLRFDPRGLDGHARETLRRQAAEWLEEFSDQQEEREPADAR